MNRFVLLIILCLTINSYAQNNKIIYQHILHPNILNNDETLKLATSIIEEEAKLNPEMIYFRVHMLNEIYGNMNNTREANGQNELNYAKRNYIAERNTWLNKQIENLSENYNDVSRVNTVISFFEDLKVGTKMDSPNFNIEVDQNLMDFYVVFYLSKGAINQYHESISYNELRSKNETSIINHIQTISELVNNAFDNHGYELYEEIENNIPFVINKEVIDYAEVLLKIENEVYSVGHINKLGFGINYFDVVHRQNRPIDLTSKYKQTATQIGELKTSQNLAIEISYKFMIKKIISPVSYIDVSVFYIKTNSEAIVNVDDKYIVEPQNEKSFSSIEYKTYDFNNLHFEDGKHYDFGFKILTPIYAFTPKITIEAGLSVYSSFDSYHIDYNLNYKNYIARYRIDGYYSHSENIEIKDGIFDSKNIKKNHFRISPVISAQYNNIIDHFDIRFTTDWHYYSTGIRLTY